jgi:hypothetical protein
VRRRDRRAVEVGERPDQAQPPQVDLVGRGGEQVLHERVVGGAVHHAVHHARSAVTSRSRTRSRSSCVAARLKVASSSCDSSSPSSATWRVARVAMVHVLPVPALACSTVVPVAGGRTGRTASGPRLSRASSGAHSRRARTPKRVGSSPSPGSPSSRSNDGSGPWARTTWRSEPSPP